MDPKTMTSEDLLGAMSKSYEGEYELDDKLIGDKKYDPDWDLYIEPLKKGVFTAYKCLMNFSIYLRFSPFSGNKDEERFFRISQGDLHNQERWERPILREIRSSDWPSSEEESLFLLSGSVTLHDLFSRGLAIEVLGNEHPKDWEENTRKTPPLVNYEFIWDDSAIINIKKL